MTKNVTPELVAEVRRLSIQEHRRKIEEIEQATKAASNSAALAALGQCVTDSLIELPEICERLAAGLPLYSGSVASALAVFGEEADALRAMLAPLEADAAE